MHRLLSTGALISTALALAFGFVCEPAQCQSSIESGPSKVVLKEGSEVLLTFAEDIGSKRASEGDPVMFTLAQDLAVNGMIVARAGAKAAGEVTNAKKAGMMGKGGELNVRLEHLNAGDAKVRIRGTKAREGDSKVGAAVALTVLFGPVGFLKHGKDIEIRQGTPLTAYVAEDITLPLAR
jgi:hypothetical protein